MSETVSTSTREAQPIRPRFVPGRSGMENIRALPPHSSPQREVRPASLPVPPKPKLLEQVRAAIRLRHYSLRTEEAYVQWIKRFIFFPESTGNSSGPQPW